MLTIILAVLLISACNTDENPCPGVEVDVEIDSANLTAHIVASGLDDVAFDLYINDQLVESVEAGELDTTEFEYQFEPGEYKVCISAESETCDQRIEGCIEFVIEDPNKEECLGLNFRKDQIDNYNYKFFADFEGIENIAYDWYINEDLVKSEPLSDQRTNFLEYEFEPGEYTICIVAETDACGEVAYCNEIVVEKVCPEEVFFEAEKENEYTYIFYADFPEKEHVQYVWYVNDEPVDEENEEGQETDHKLFWQFDAGIHSVCLVTNDEGCQEIEYCETIEVAAQDCRTISYTSDLNEENNTYTFTADFEGRDDVTYIWKVYINDDLQGEEVREAGSDADHQFEWTMEPGVEYEVCLKEDGNCLENQVCNVFSIAP